MIIVRMMQYWNDYHKKELREKFRGLKELEDWIFGQMRVDYSSAHGRDLLSFPECDVEKHIYQISIQPEYGGCVYWIKQIEEECSGIIFSDGTFTAGQKHCTRAVREWLAGCEERKRNPTFRFAPDGAGADGGPRENNACGCADGAGKDRNSKGWADGMMPGGLIRKVAKRIHSVGGCDAEDEYGRGYDDGITAALNILLEETGYVIEDILDHEESREE